LAPPTQFVRNVADDLLFLRRMRKENNHQAEATAGLQKDPDEWKTGDEPMTAAQRSYLETLSADTGENVDESLTKAEASKRIDELRLASPRVNATSDEE
jgi:hypothetical protein